MPIFKGISISLVSQFGVLTLPEFAPPAAGSGADPSAKPGSRFRLHNKSESSVSVYVPMFSNSTFWIGYSIPEPDPVKMFYFKLYVNGRHIVSWGCCKRDGFKGKTMFALSEDTKRNGRLIRQALSFGKEEEASSDDVLTIKVYRARGRRRVDTNSKSFIPTNSKNLDLGVNKNDKSPVVLVQGGRLPRVRPFNHYRYALEDAVESPYAIFRYLPRSYPQLAALGVNEEFVSVEGQLHYSTSSSSLRSEAPPQGPHDTRIKEEELDENKTGLLANVPTVSEYMAGAERPSAQKAIPSRIHVPKLQLPSPSLAKPPSPIKRNTSNLPQLNLCQQSSGSLPAADLPESHLYRTKRNLTPSPNPIVGSKTTRPVPHAVTTSIPQPVQTPRAIASMSASPRAQNFSRLTGRLPVDAQIQSTPPTKIPLNFSHPSPLESIRSKVPLTPGPPGKVSNKPSKLPHPALTKPSLPPPEAQTISGIPKKPNPAHPLFDQEHSSPASAFYTGHPKLLKRKEHANIRSVFDDLEAQHSISGGDETWSSGSWVKIPTRPSDAASTFSRTSRLGRFATLPALSRPLPLSKQRMDSTLLVEDESDIRGSNSAPSDAEFDVCGDGMSRQEEKDSSPDIREEFPSPAMLDGPPYKYPSRIADYGGREDAFVGPSSPLGKGAFAPPNLKKKNGISKAKRERELEPIKYDPGKKGKSKGKRGDITNRERGKGDIEFAKNVFR